MSTTVPSVRSTVACWFEIPSDNYERAIAFYENVFATTLRREKFGGDIAVFPYDRPGVSGCIIHRPGESGAAGPVIYLNADGQLDAMLGRVLAAGGEIVVPQQAVAPGTGGSAIITDPDGNRVGLHAMI
jgi:predicted enzyme related to lactoylglutathione lyase